MESVASTDFSTLWIAGFTCAAGAVFWYNMAFGGWVRLLYSLAGQKRRFDAAIEKVRLIRAQLFACFPVVLSRSEPYNRL